MIDLELEQVLNQAHMLATQPGHMHPPPQPAGKIVADWYQKQNPSEQEMLYVIAELLAMVDGVSQ